MKCKLIKDCSGANPDVDKTRPSTPIGGDNPHSVLKPAGTVIDHPDAWMLCTSGEKKVLPGGQVRQAVAVPADEECEQRVAQFNEQRQRRKEALAGQADGNSMLREEQKRIAAAAEKADAAKPAKSGK